MKIRWFYHYYELEIMVWFNVIVCQSFWFIFVLSFTGYYFLYSSFGVGIYDWSSHGTIVPKSDHFLPRLFSKQPSTTVQEFSMKGKWW